MLLRNFPLRTAWFSLWEKELMGFTANLTCNPNLLRKPLPWDMLWDSNTEVLAAEGGKIIMWIRLALAYFLLCRALDLFAYDSGMVHSEYCLGKIDLAFFRGV